MNKTMTTVVLCLFIVDSVAWAYPDIKTKTSKNTLAVQSIFKPLTDAGIKDSAEVEFEILAGIRLILAGKSPTAANGFLTEMYKNLSDKNRRIEFLEDGLQKDGKHVMARFGIIGKKNLKFEIDYHDTVTAAGDRSVINTPRLVKAEPNKILQFTDVFQRNDEIAIRKITVAESAGRKREPVSISGAPAAESEVAPMGLLGDTGALIARLVTIELNSSSTGFQRQEARGLIIKMQAAPTDDLMEKARAFISRVDASFADKASNGGPRNGFVENGSNLLVPDKRITVPGSRDLAVAEINKRFALAAIREKEVFLKYDKDRQIAVIRDILDLWELPVEGEAPPEADAVIEIISARIDDEVRHRLYALLERVAPSYDYTDTQLQALLASIYARRDYEERFTGNLIDKLTERLELMSDRTYSSYLDLLSAMEPRFRREGIPHLPPDMTFGVELELSLLNKKDNTVANGTVDSLCAALGNECAQLIESGALRTGWVVKKDRAALEINTPALTNTREGFEELERGVNAIRIFIHDWLIQRGDLYLTRNIHIHIGNPKRMAVPPLRALTFIGKAMEYYWNVLSPVNDIGKVAFKDEALTGYAYNEKNKTIWYEDTGKGTFAFNGFYSPKVLDNDFLARLQATIGIAMQIVHAASTRPDDFNILRWGLPVMRNATLTAQNSALLKRSIDELYANNKEGKKSMLNTLMARNKKPLPEAGRHITQVAAKDPIETFYAARGLGLLYDIHATSPNGRHGDMEKTLAALHNDPSKKAALITLYGALLETLHTKENLLLIARLLNSVDPESAPVTLANLWKTSYTLKGHTDRVTSASFSPDGRRIVSSSDDDDRTIRVWDAEGGALLHTLKDHTNRVTSASFSPDGRRIVSSSGDCMIRIWSNLYDILETPRPSKGANVTCGTICDLGHDSLSKEAGIIRDLDEEPLTGSEVINILKAAGKIDDATAGQLQSIASAAESAGRGLNSSEWTPAETVLTTVEEMRLSGEYKDEDALSRESRGYLKGIPLNMRVDLSVIPRGRGEEGELEQNMATLARLIAWHKALGFNIHYILEDSDDAYRAEAERLLKAEIAKLAAIPDIDADDLSRRVGSPHTGDGVIEVILRDIKKVEKMGKEDVKENDYIVALTDDTGKEGVAIPNYTAASAIGISQAALGVAQRKESRPEYERVKGKLFDKINFIYKRYEIGKGFTLDILEFMVTGCPENKLKFAIQYALPPIVKLVLEKLKTYHDRIQLLLQAA